MMFRSRITAANAFAAILATAVSCSGLTGGPRKIVVTDGVCGNVRFLKMKLGVTNRLVLDNRKPTESQVGLGLIMTDFPVIVKGEVPENSTIGAQKSTIRLRANPGEQKTVDLEPTFTGEYKAQCNVFLQRDANQRIVQQDLTFELTDK